MPALRPIAIARDFGEIHAALRSYIEQVNVSRISLDDLAGWPSGYSGKVLAPRPIKPLTSKGLGELMQATGLVLIVAQDVEAFARRQHRLTPRHEGQVRLGTDMRARFAAKKEREARDQRNARRRALRAARRAATQGETP